MLIENKNAARHTAKRRGIIFLGNEYAALQVEKSGENAFTLSYLESRGSESGDAQREEKILWSEKISRRASLAQSETNFAPECVGGANLSALESKKARSEERITFKLKFTATRDGKSGTVRFFVNTRGFEQKISFKSAPFTTTNAHWVGGRYGWF